VKVFALKVAAVAAAVWSLVLLETETSLIFSPKQLISVLLQHTSQNPWLTFSLTIVILCMIISTAFFTIFKLKFSDYLQLVPGHTDCVTFTSFVSMFSQLITVACFNYMVMTD
jgi:hypothetical protein